MKFTVQTPPAPEPVLTPRQKFDKGCRRIRDHYAGKEGEARLAKMIGQSFDWTLRLSAALTGLSVLIGILLCALFATADDWKLLAAALRLATADNLNNLLHHEVMPQLFFGFAKIWAARIGIELLAIGFSPAWPNGVFGKRVDLPSQKNS